MFALIAITLLVALSLYYVTGIGFEMGDGFTEMKKKARDVDYKIVDRESNPPKFSEKTLSGKKDKKMLQ